MDKKKNVILYDMIMPWPILSVFFLFQIIGNYLWNFIVLVTILIFLNKAKIIGFKSILKKNILITIVGAILDLAALGLLSLSRNLGIHILVILALVSLLALFNYFMGWKYFGLSKKQAYKLGLAMGIFTTPWIYAVIDLLSTTR